MPSLVDPTLYPDTDPPERLETLAERVDFLARLCAAWDFGVLPEPEVARWLKEPEWREAVEACGLATSVAYHLLREWHGLPEIPYLGRKIPEIADDPCLQRT
ncbi:MAG: hypothetical protein MI919_27315 [Holophagales bacterium]|nr:hypothetical protein [Holophagales bacterium]